MTSDERQPPAELQVDPDIEADSSHSTFPSIDLRIVLAVFVGGIFGGLARYGIGLVAAPAPGGFPWDIFAINLGGAFSLALLLVLVLDVLPPTRFVRPALGTGFLGAFTTFSSLATATDHLAAHGHPSIAATYVVTSLVGGVLATLLGVVAGRAIGGR